MQRNRLRELHYIAHMDNLASIRERGILCHADAEKLKHNSVAMAEIQDRRAKVKVPNGLRLHEYANLYFHARNPMMYKRKDLHEQLTVLSIDCAVLDLEGAVIADANASGDYVGFWPSPKGLEKVDEERTFAEYWTDPDPIEYWRKKSKKCAEVLVPSRVDPKYVRGLYVSGDQARTAIARLGLEWQPTLNPHLFFR